MLRFALFQNISRKENETFPKRVAQNIARKDKMTMVNQFKNEQK